MTLKRALASIAAAATALAGLAIGAAGASADTTDTGNITQDATQTITITNAQDGTTFTAYQLAEFTNATIAKGSDDLKAISSLEMTTLPAANTALKTAIQALNDAAEKPSGWSDVELTVPYVNDGTDATDTSDENLAALVATLSDGQLRALANQLDQQLAADPATLTAAGTATASEGSDGQVTISGLKPGWYLVISTAPTADGKQAEQTSPAIVPSTVTGYTSIARTAGQGTLTLGQLVAKHSNLPEVRKTNNLDAAGKHAVGIGDTVPYTITTKLAGASSEDGTVTYHAIKDTPSKGLTVYGHATKDETSDKALVVKVKDVALEPSEYTVTGFDANGTLEGDGETPFVIDLTSYAQQHRELAGATVTVTYHGTVNDAAVDEITNLVSLDDTEVTDTDTVRLGRVEFTKVGVDDKDSNDARGLAGASFQVTGADGKTALSFVDNGDGTYTYLPAGATATSPVTSVTSPTGDDRGHIALLGLPEGTYSISETDVPSGYSAQFKAQFTVKVAASKSGEPTATTLTGKGLYGLASADGSRIFVKNVKSITQLPLTGAAGIGMLLAVAVLLGGAGALIALRARSLKRQLRG